MAFIDSRTKKKVLVLKRILVMKVNKVICIFPTKTIRER
jgi:hypothetical protein